MRKTSPWPLQTSNIRFYNLTSDRADMTWLTLILATEKLSNKETKQFFLCSQKTAPTNLLPLTGSPEAIAKFPFGTFKKQPQKSASPYGVAGGYRQIFIWYFQKTAQKSASPYGVAGGYRQKSILTFFSCSREFCPFEKELRLNTLFLISNVRIRAIVSAKGRKPVEKVCQLIFHCLKTLKTKITCNWCIYIKMC